MIPICPILLLSLFLVFGASSVPIQNKVYPSPDKRLRAIIIPVGKKGFESQESRIEIRKSDGTLIRWKSFASEDGEHGRGVEHGEWTADGEFFVFNTQSSGGHQPWNWAIYFYSRQKNRFYSLDAFIGPVTSDFTLAGKATVKTTRFNFEKEEEREAVTVRLHKLVK
ncbi:MAG TPA: hypothetical protein VNO70_27355 [Blastocatellia bacterium]|nr:hypothetical protein [Blastocatellia bacterium]